MGSYIWYSLEGAGRASEASYFRARSSALSGLLIFFLDIANDIEKNEIKQKVEV